MEKGQGENTRKRRNEESGRGRDMEEGRGKQIRECNKDKERRKERRERWE